MTDPEILSYTLEEALLRCADPQTRAEYEELCQQGFDGKIDPAPIGAFLWNGGRENEQKRRDPEKFGRAHRIRQQLDDRLGAILLRAEWYCRGSCPTEWCRSCG